MKRKFTLLERMGDQQEFRMSVANVHILFFWICCGLFPLSSIAQLKLPEPTGPYQIGTQYFHFVDHDRAETFTSTPDDYREVTAQVWYPAQPVADAMPKPYRDKQEAILLSAIEANFFGLVTGGELPVDMTSQFSDILTHSYENAPLINTPEPLPVLIYSHGIIAGHVTIHTALMEALASHGYIVFSIGHAYQSAYLKYPDGTLKAFSRDTEAIQKVLADFRKGGAIYQELSQTDDVEAQKALIKQTYEARAFLQESVYIWAEDIRQTMDALEKLNQDNATFAGHLDLNHIGVFGWSFGGASSGQVCIMDQRCKAGINIDGIPMGDLADEPISQPFMFFRNGDRFLEQHYVNQLSHDGYLVKIQGTSHVDFTDMTLYNIPEIDPILGDIDGERMTKIVNAYVLAFFDKYLRGIESSLLEASSADYPEVLFQRWLLKDKQSY